MKVSMKKMFSVLFTAVVLSTAALQITPAQAGDEYKFKSVVVANSNGVKIKIKEKRVFGLGGWKHVQKIKVKVKGAHTGGLYVYANGASHAGVYADGYYHYDLNESVDSLYFSPGAADCLLDGITVIANEHTSGFHVGFGGGRGWAGSFPSEVVTQIINETNAFVPYVNLDDQKTYLEPIRILAGRAMGMSMGRGDFSMKTSAAIVALIQQINFSEQFITQRLQVNATYWNAVNLIASKERLSDLLDYDAPAATPVATN